MIFVRKKDSNYQKSWELVFEILNQTKDTAPKKSGADVAVAAPAASATASTRAAGPIRATVEVQNTPTQPIVQSSAPLAQLASPMDFANMMAASIEAALKPLREKLEATIIPMQRTIESMQAEFVATSAEKDDEAMP